MNRSFLFRLSSLLLLCGLAACGDNASPSVPDAHFSVDGGPLGARDAALPDGSPSSDGETCDNGLDDDTDGTIDEGCYCLPGQTQACFSGPATSRGVGACSDGMQTCGDALEFGTWGPCEGEAPPASAEVCDGAVDENCDGAVDEGCGCDPTSGPVPCGLDEGVCEAGSQECVAGMLGDCVGGTGPGTETCNGMDDDCDGMSDEALTRRCGTDVGECTRGRQTCLDGRWDTCSGGRTAGTEDCNGLDDDCDGMTDEALSRGCGTGVGECSMGTQACTSGSWAMCAGGTSPTVESCNSRDDDCDSRTDEGVSRACGSSTGICRPGTQTCTAGTFGTCTGGVGPGTETCDGSLDQDCDGTVDEGCGCTGGTMRSCGTDVGECVAGSQTCSTGGSWGGCTGDVGPVPELCNTRDDDCDTRIDESGACPTTPPVVMCGAGVTADVLSTVTVSGTGSDPDGGAVSYMWTVTTRPAGSTSMPASPTSPSTSFYLDASGTFVLRLCITDDEGQTACCNVTITSTPPGVLQVELAWDEAYGDVDLHLLNVTRTPPAGWWTVDDCHYANPNPDWPPPGASSNPSLDIDDVNGYGPENISIVSTPASGTYNIGVHYYCESSPAGSGTTDATIRVYCMGSLIATYTGIRLDETDDWVNVARVTWPGCVGMSVNTRTTGVVLLPSGSTAPRHCEIPCTSSADCRSPEVCRSVIGPGGRRNICWL